MKVRIKYRRYGAVKFIGHLDMMRYFQKALRRAEIDMKYSEGFNPHMILSFAAPLGVGITSDGEYFDIEVNATRSSEESVRALNEAMVEGVEVLSYKALPDHAKKSMSIVAAADYEIFFKEGYDSPKTMEEFGRIFHDFYVKRDAILIVKQTKKSERTMDLKPFIYEFSIHEKNGKPSFRMKVRTGSTDNIKPELVLSEMFQFAGLTYRPEAVQIHRLETYAENERGFITLDAMGENIV